MKKISYIFLLLGLLSSVARGMDDDSHDDVSSDEDSAALLNQLPTGSLDYMDDDNHDDVSSDKDSAALLNQLPTGSLDYLVECATKVLNKETHITKKAIKKLKKGIVTEKSELLISLCECDISTWKNLCIDIDNPNNELEVYLCSYLLPTEVLKIVFDHKKTIESCKLIERAIAIDPGYMKRSLQDKT